MTSENYGYYDRDGRPLSNVEYDKMPFAEREAKKRVAWTSVKGGGWVSTVWLLGINHNFIPGGAPLLFETMAFDAKGHEIDDMTQRYENEPLALVGHAEVVAALGGEVQKTESNTVTAANDAAMHAP